MKNKKNGKKITVNVSHPNKLLFPISGITKGDVVAYYEKIAPHMLPLIKDHLIVLQRFPHGIDQEGFYQKQASEFFPDWLHTHTIELRKGETQDLVLLEKTEDLMFLANLAVVTMHAWLSPITSIEKPDRIIFDLDPSNKTTIADLHEAALHLKKILEDHNLVPFIMTTGSRGYHIVAPIIPLHTFETVHEFCKQIADYMATTWPKAYTTEINKSKRNGKIFIDYLRNSYGQTGVAPYSLRAREDAPIATPLEWEELKASTPQKYTLNNIFRRLARKKNVWQNFSNSAKKLILKKAKMHHSA